MADRKKGKTMSMTPDEHRAAAAQAERNAQESYERSDTDGFVSQWASGMTARLHRAQAELDENGGKHEYSALFDTDGNLVAAKLVDTRFGMSWGLLPSDDPHGSFTGWFNPSKAKSAETRKANDAKKGYQIGRILVSSKAELMGSGTGLSGAASVYVGYYRTDGGFSRDVEIVSKSHYEDR